MLRRRRIVDRDIRQRQRVLSEHTPSRGILMRVDAERTRYTLNTLIAFITLRSFWAFGSNRSLHTLNTLWTLATGIPFVSLGALCANGSRCAGIAF